MPKFHVWPALLAGACLLSSCAQDPQYVEPTYVSDVPYQALSCRQLGIDQDRLLNAVQIASTRQQTASNNDAVGVLLLGLPIGSMAGEDNAQQLARLKGELEAVQTALKSKDCSKPDAP